MNPTIKTCQRMIVAAVLVIATMFAVPTVAKAATPGFSQSGPIPRVLCFPAQLWSVEPGDRPCYSVTGPSEDGSGRLSIHAADRKLYRFDCALPNPREVRGKFLRIKCKRVRYVPPAQHHPWLQVGS